MKIISISYVWIASVSAWSSHDIAVVLYFYVFKFRKLRRKYFLGKYWQLSIYMLWKFCACVELHFIFANLIYMYVGLSRGKVFLTVRFIILVLIIIRVSPLCDIVIIFTWLIWLMILSQTFVLVQLNVSNRVWSVDSFESYVW